MVRRSEVPYREDNSMQSAVSNSDVKSIIADLKDPETGRTMGEMGQVLSISTEGGRIEVKLGLTSYSSPIWDEVVAKARESLEAAFPQATQISVTHQTIERPAEKLGTIGLTVKSVIAVGSGKGGVGKSTIAACIALGLKRAGCKVGLMDADVYGPSIPHLLGLEGRPHVVDNTFDPIRMDGMPVMSMGFLVPPGEAVVWRGPMLHGAITQFLRQTNWGDLDYLIIDMPPGTGDIALTLSQMLPLTGAIVVCTPQDVALLDAVKAIAMFRKVNIPVLGMVENMSGFICPDNGKRYDIFGSGGARKRAAELDVPFLGDVPIYMSVRERGDEGTTDKNYDDPQTAAVFQRICKTLVRNLAQKAAIAPPMASLPILS
jgi:ATP-binding protein involved in chromosome partitioning